MGHCQGKIWVFVTLCRWLWIVVDHCGLVAAGCGSLGVVVGHCRLLWFVVIGSSLHDVPL